MGKAAVPYDNFYYMSGLIVGDMLGNRPNDFKHKFIDHYKRFVDDSGGKDAFRDPEEAVKKFLSTFKGEARGRRQ